MLTVKDWGAEICARIRGRKELGREPTPEEVKGLRDNDRHKLTTPQEVMAALDAGTEVRRFNVVFVRSLTITIQRLAVWTLKCVGYENDFQLQLTEKFPLWQQQQKGKRAKRMPAQNGNGVRHGRKRKRADTPESEEMDEGKDE